MVVDKFLDGRGIVKLDGCISYNRFIKMNKTIIFCEGGVADCTPVYLGVTVQALVDPVTFQLDGVGGNTAAIFLFKSESVRKISSTIDGYCDAEILVGITITSRRECNGHRLRVLVESDVQFLDKRVCQTVVVYK